MLLRLNRSSRLGCSSLGGFDGTNQKSLQPQVVIEASVATDGRISCNGCGGQDHLRCPLCSWIVSKSFMDNFSFISTALAAKHLGVSMSWLRSKESTCEFIVSEIETYSLTSAEEVV